MACNCVSSKVWDVMTLACIDICWANNSTCMRCSDLPGATGEMAEDLVVSRCFAVGTPAGSGAIKALNTASFSNYAKISIYMCPCRAGYKWDIGRLRCLNENYV